MDTSIEVCALESLTFEALFAGERTRLFTSLWLVTRDRHEAEEMAQLVRAFVKVWERWDRRGAPDDPTAYLFRTAMNIMRNRRRRAAVALRHAPTRKESADGLDAVESRDVVMRSPRSLDALSACRARPDGICSICLRPITDALGAPASTVRVLAARGRATLATQNSELTMG